MKKYLKIALPVLLFLLVAVLVYAISQKVARKATEQKDISEIPSFSFLAIDSTVYTASRLASDKKTLVIYFNSECEHCQYEAQELAKNADKFSNTQIIMVSSENLPAIRAFYQKYQLSKLAYLQMLKAEGDSFSSYFGRSSVPAIFIYDASGKLLKNYKGETKIEAILKVLGITL